jgi:hypothetical protein
VLENDRVRVSKLRLAPGQSSGKVKFTKPRLLVFMEEGKIVIAAELQSQTIEAGRGSLNMQESPHTETMTNLGDRLVEMVIVETK